MTGSVYIGLGSNLGDREENLLRAVDALSRIDAVAVLGRSSLYETGPIGPEQPRFLNAAVHVECGLPPTQLLAILKEIERDLGREANVRWGPRTIDLDILLWEGMVVEDAQLQIPHGELHNRRFALEPLCELNPVAWHPVLGATVDELLTRLAPQDVVRYETASWKGPELPGEI